VRFDETSRCSFNVATYVSEITFSFRFRVNYLRYKSKKRKWKTEINFINRCKNKY